MVNEDSFILSLIEDGFSEDEAEIIAQDYQKSENYKEVINLCLTTFCLQVSTQHLL